MTIKKARETMVKAFNDDPDFLHSYIDNIACLLMDDIPRLKHNKTKRDIIALKIIGLIFK